MQTRTLLNDKQARTNPYVVAPPTTTAAEKPPVSVETISEATPPDVREALFNRGAVGPITHIQVSTERIAQINGILFDIEPTNLREGPLMPALSNDPEEFYENCLLPWLANHKLLQHLEVRATGMGLHAILWVDPQVEFATDAERKRWCSIVKIVQATLPTHPLAPGLTATTRALGSVNSKNGQTVRLLKEGTPVSPEDVIALSEQMCAAPFKTSFTVLTGTNRMSPCPVCGKESLVALDHIGTCCGCGRITFERLCNELFQQQKSAEA